MQQLTNSRVDLAQERGHPETQRHALTRCCLRCIVSLLIAILLTPMGSPAQQNEQFDGGGGRGRLG